MLTNFDNFGVYKANFKIIYTSHFFKTPILTNFTNFAVNKALFNFFSLLSFTEFFWESTEIIFGNSVIYFTLLSFE